MNPKHVQDTNAKIMKEVCSDIKIEPNMLPVGMNNIIGNNADNARLDISAIEEYEGARKGHFLM